MRTKLLCSVAALAAACTAADDRPATTAAPIIGGAASPDDHAVVLLASYPPDRSVLATCTATLVAPDVLLTAAHCVDTANHPGWIFGMFPDADASIYPTLVALEPHLVPVREVHVHPSYDPSPPFTADIAVALLATPSTITPLPIRRTALTAAMAGQAARIIGYGQATVGVPSMTRRQASTVIAGLDAGDTVRVGDPQHLTCLGDSGGPATIMEGGVETVIGVDSYADNGNCDSPAHFRRTDAHRSFLETYVGAAPGPDAGTGAGADAGTEGGGDDSGGCATGGGSSTGGALIVGLGLALLRRRRR
ncbi:MAG: trypsin-like serine protease [Myxococcales bacterium]|nr:trypsin-like serine protease [Myxococcales bacterium]